MLQKNIVGSNVVNAFEYNFGMFGGNGLGGNGFCGDVTGAGCCFVLTTDWPITCSKCVICVYI